MGDGSATDRSIGAPTVDEAAWRGWLDSSGIASRGMPTAHAGRTVVVAPHPDDEVLACGGWLAQQLGAGAEALVIAVTDGEASHPGDPAWTPSRLAAARRAESARGIAELALPGGPLPTIVRLGLPDGGVAGATDRLADALDELLRPGDRIVTTWRCDGHPDHDATGSTVAVVAGRIGCGLLEAPVWMWHRSRPDDPRVPWHRLRALPLDAATLAAKQRAIAAHTSQLAPAGGTGYPVLDPPILARARRPFETFFVADRAGPGGG